MAWPRTAEMLILYFLHVCIHYLGNKNTLICFLLMAWTIHTCRLFCVEWFNFALDYKQLLVIGNILSCFYDPWSVLHLVSCGYSDFVIIFKLGMSDWYSYLICCSSRDRRVWHGEACGFHVWRNFFCNWWVLWFKSSWTWNIWFCVLCHPSQSGLQLSTFIIITSISLLSKVSLHNESSLMDLNIFRKLLLKEWLLWKLKNLWQRWKSFARFITQIW